MTGRSYSWFLLVAAAVSVASAFAVEEPQVSFDPYKYVIWLPVHVNGGPLLTFGFDSAAARSAIDWDRAEELKIPFTRLGELNAGSGDGLARSGRTGAVRLAIPGAVLELPSMGVVPLTGVSETYGRRIDGLVGAELLARYVVELDWETQRIQLHEPERYSYSGKGAEIPLILADNMPFVRMQISVPGTSPAEGLFLVDCPHPGTIIINRPFVEENGFLEAARRSIPRLVTQYAEGVNGKSAVLYGRITEIKLGPFALHEPTVGFSQAKSGALAQAEFSGILGAEILRRFHVIFDFSRERMILEPKAALAQPYRYDASGMRLRSTGPDLHQYVITGVIEDSPAAKAKLQEGDRLVEIGGKSPQSLSLGEILDILKRDGEILPLKVRRGSETLGVALALKQLI